MLSLDQQVLLMLSEGGGHVAFSGLRRSLEVHPESLVRTLRRLQRSGEIGKDGLGYFLREPAPRGARSTPSWPLASVRLPVPLAPDTVLGALAGRWFGPLRWVGTYDARRPPALVWSMPGVDGLLVLQARGDRLVLRAEGNVSATSRRALTAAGEELLWHVLGRLRAFGPATVDLGEPSPQAPPGTLALAVESPPPSVWGG